MSEPILQVKNLHVHYITDDETVMAVNGVSFALKQGESLGLVGETGAGKTTTALSVMQLIPDPPGVIVDGDILFEGKNLIYNTPKENQAIRGNGISMIFQDPMTALNPILTVGEQLVEVLVTHKKLHRGEAKRQAVEFLELVAWDANDSTIIPTSFPAGKSSGWSLQWPCCAAQRS